MSTMTLGSEDLLSSYQIMEYPHLGATDAIDSWKKIVRAQTVLQIQTHYAKKGVTLGAAATLRAKSFVEWQHYPKNDLVDTENGFRLYYHAHSANDMPAGEHGHFHVFKSGAHNSSAYFHIIGIALDLKGLPVRLFTTNPWVTGESMATSAEIAAAVGVFDIKVAGRLSPVGSWVSGIIHLFDNEIQQLVRERDDYLRILSADTNVQSILEDRKYAVLSQSKIDLMKRLAQYL